MTACCNLIIDSCCDLPYEVVDHPGIELLKFPYRADGKEFYDDLYQSQTPHIFFDEMRHEKDDTEYPTTAQMPATVLKETFERAAQSGIPTVYLSFSSALSGSFDAACLIKDEVCGRYPDAELYLVDTKLASIAEGLLVFEAIRQRDSGMSASEMVTWAEEARYFVNAQFMVDDLDALRRGGRIPAGVAMAGAKLDVKPLLGIDLSGKLSLTGVARGRKKGIRQLSEYYSKRIDCDKLGNQVVIAGSDCPKDMSRFKDFLSKTDDSLLLLESSIGPVIGSHVGPDMVAIVFWGPDRRKDISVSDRIANHVRGRN
jgi:DegV family protein with EDD domain